MSSGDIVSRIHIDVWTILISLAWIALFAVSPLWWLRLLWSVLALALILLRKLILSPKQRGDRRMVE